MNKVFSPFQINSKVTMPNRLAVAPMTTQQSNADGTLSSAESSWLKRLSNDGYGLVISCAVSISDTSIAFYNQLSIAHDSMILPLKELSDKMKQNRSVNLLQLCHGGSRTIEALTGEKSHSASSYSMPMISGFVSPKKLSKVQIKAIVYDFAAACARAEKAGFDGIELHGANGYLFTQFISTMTNQRSDDYGGNLENRAKFSREVVRACRAEVSEDFIIGFKMNFEGMGLETGLDIDENIQIANWLAEDGVNYIHSSQLNYESHSVKYPEKNLIEYIRSGLISSLPLAAAGNIKSLEDAQKAMDLGLDIVAIGRAAIANIDLPKYFEKNEALPFKTPFSEEQLIGIGISEGFLDYLKNAPPLKSLAIIKT
ncbi:NADH:flavin oxidoreductase [Runella sp. MFBS21]|uniref:NADH:flavin oxidoreductase n=1 Tax=Runella sp. MFBS21 TaxID=3034018 RepID=UPI0023F8DCC6|nr:NADH:flavin oxidoreductase [Runella sp. MFBS21]MDF7819251.1 NADH:flavin oxidoreductase [Runella sp. MFBS21]